MSFLFLLILCSCRFQFATAWQRQVPLKPSYRSSSSFRPKRKQPSRNGGSASPNKSSSSSEFRYRRLEDHEDYARMQHKEQQQQQQTKQQQQQQKPPSSFPRLDHILSDPYSFYHHYFSSSFSSWEQAMKKKRLSSYLRLSQTPPVVVTNVHELRRAILDDDYPMKQIDLQCPMADLTVQQALHHDVLQLIAERFHSQSTPGHRTDNATLALAFEGGGMRGCVSAGMAAAIGSLGLCNVFDSIYGSSAGSVIGAYMVSRQMCVDVYVDILPAAKKQFVCKHRMMKSLASNLMDVLLLSIPKNNNNNNMNNMNNNAQKPTTTTTTTTTTKTNPGMNISFVLDGVLGQENGIRPLDMETFLKNDQKQPLRVVSSCVDRDGTLVSKTFGTADFMTARRTDGKRRGLWACLEASMTVPGATGPPVDIVYGQEGDEADEKPLPCFDAFCFEPLPYRSAVQEGATHVLVCCSRPEGFEPKTKPGVYEQGIANIYFRSHDHPNVATFFEKGGQQYIYAEDLLTLEEAKFSTDGVLVPPPQPLHGIPEATAATDRLVRERDQVWKKAHLLPLKVPRGTPELPTLEQDKDAVLEAVRGGFSAAFDLLVPAIGLELNISGEEAAKLVFPSSEENQTSESILQTKVHVMGEPIPSEGKSPAALQDILNDVLQGPVIAAGTSTKQRISQMAVLGHVHRQQGMHQPPTAATLLATLPGFQEGRMGHLAKGLRLIQHKSQLQQSNRL